MENYRLDFARSPESYRVGYLIKGFIQHWLTIREEEELDEFILSSVENMKIFEDLTEDGTAEGFVKWFDVQLLEDRQGFSTRPLKFRKKLSARSWFKYSVAACIVIITGIVIYFFLNDPGKDQTAPAIVIQYDVPTDLRPGSLKATLKLADGRLVALRQQQDTIVNDQVQIRDSFVYYNNKSRADEYNEISVPRKGYYQLVLADGTKVWLNSESSIRYPATFNDAERRVTVSGETYFEVAEDATKPFIVSVNGIEVRALGTAFNINAYPNEQFRITLKEGSIMVSGNGQEKLVKPGEQLRIEDGLMEIIRQVTMDAITAWKSNTFIFKRTGLREVMRMMERWYGCKVIIDPDVEDVRYIGVFSRSTELSQILEILQKVSHIKFIIEGTTVRVTN